jgi:hypothetical protein
MQDPDELRRPAAGARAVAGPRARGGALGVFFIGFVQDPEGRAGGRRAAVFPQMFLAGALIPVRVERAPRLLAKLMPMTYSIDLARKSSMGQAEYSGVLHPWTLDWRCRSASSFLHVVGRSSSSAPTGNR